MSFNNNHNGKRALIMTVGLSSGPKEGSIVDALMIDVEEYEPLHVVLACTPRSREVADELAGRVKQTGAACEIIDLDDAHDLNAIFDSVRAVIFRLREEGYGAEDIAVNYASGTKVMSSGLTLAAVFSSCGALRYVRSGAGPGRDRRLISTPAGAIFANRDIMQAMLLGSELLFESACRILENVRMDFLTDSERRLSHDLMTLFTAYGEWDAFRMGEFLNLYGKVEFEPQIDKFQLSDEGLAAARELAAALDAERPSRLICVDLFNSAQRRRHMGNLNDALARLYRALELLAQDRLIERWDIDPDDVNAQKAPPRHRPDFEALRSPSDGKIRLGLRKAYELLYRLEDDLGVDFQADEQMARRLEERRETMLAHGIEPVSRKVADAFFDWTQTFFQRHIEDFDERARRLQFPWLSDQ